MIADRPEMKLGTLSVRQADLDDRETMFRIHVDAVSALCGTHYSREQIDGWFVGRSPSDYTGPIEWGGDWIACRDGEPVGFVEFFTHTISMLYVLPDNTGRGVGSQLLRFAVHSMRGKTEVIELEALRNAAGFYERRGFRKVGDSCIRRPSGLVLPTILMERRQ